MKLMIRNVGPFVGKQEIQLDGITILAGLNGAGKSTFGKVLYCAFSAFYNIEDMVRRDKIKTIYRLIRSSLLENRKNFRQLQMVVDSYSDKLLISKDIDEQIIDEFLAEIVGNGNVLNEQGMLKTKIIEALSIDNKKIREKILENRIEAEFGNQIRNVHATNENAEVDLLIKENKISFSYGANGVCINEYIPLVKNVLYFDDPNVADDLEWGILYSIEEESHRSDLERKLMMGKNEDFSNIDQILLQEKIKRIEAKINIICDGDIAYTEAKQFMYLSKDFQDGLKIGNMATGLKSFAVLKMLLKKGCFEENGTIIFDEPEIHLHPEWQKAWAEIIVLLHKELGMHVLLSTHSSDFLSFLELFVHKYDVTEKTKLYQLERNASNISCIKDVDSNWDKVYSQLGKPFICATEELDELNDNK